MGKPGVRRASWEGSRREGKNIKKIKKRRRRDRERRKREE